MRARPSLILGTALATAAGTCLVGTSAATAAPAPAPVHRAAVAQAAASGGRVIVTLRNQLKQLPIKKDGAQRRSSARSSQRGVVSDLRTHGATDIRQLVSVNAVAAHASRAEVARLRLNPDVASIVRDLPVETPQANALPAANVSSKICPTNPAKPLLEPEALSLMHVKSQPAQASDSDNIATGKGVLIGMTGVNDLAGNPNFIRADGSHVVIDSPTPNADDSDVDGGGDEWYGDVSSISGQGTVTYDFSKELPNSGLPSGCTFRIEGDAPDASLVDTGYFGQGDGASTTPKFESQAIAGLDYAAITEHVSVVSESYGFGSVPGETDFSPYTEANDELVAAGITVVESAGDSGVGGTVETPADDPLVIDAGATTAFRLDAQAFGYTKWQSNQMAALSSGGTTANGNVVDLVATGDGGEASCSPAAASCPQTTLTEAFGGTSESAPFIAGVAADVIQAYRDSHGGTSPTPALVKQILTGTADDIGAASDDQGSGLLDAGAAVRAAQQEPGSTVTNTSAALVPSPTQLDVSGAGGSQTTGSVTLYNASSHSTKVKGSIRSFSKPAQIGKITTENVSAPAAGTALPARGATAANDVTMKVPAGLSQLGVDMITPNPKNDAILDLLLLDPKGRLSAISYDYSSTNGQVSNNEHVSINDPMPGKWTAEIVWNNGRSHLQDPPPTPGNYRGTISVRFTGQHARTSKIGSAVTIPADSSATVPVPVSFPKAAGDAPESVQFTGTGAVTSVPIARRTLIAGPGTKFSTTLGSSVARGFGPLKTWQITVPTGEKDLRVTFKTKDTSPDNLIDYFLVDPNGIDGWYDRTADTTPQGVELKRQAGTASIVVAQPSAGLWTVQTMLDLTASGQEFDQKVTGQVAFNTSSIEAFNVPDSATTKLASGSSTTLKVGVTNTTGVGRQFSLASANGDVSGLSVYIAAGSTALVTGVLKPTAATGTDVKGSLVVVSEGSPLSPLLDADGFFFDDQTLAVAPYEYTVGPAAT
jgi:hypothetical protein